jgi:hypothetical protein
MQKLSRLFHMGTVGYVEQLNYHRRVISGLQITRRVVSNAPKPPSSASSGAPSGLAGRGGFEPPEGLKIPHPLSRRALSASQPPPQAAASICRVRLATTGNASTRRVTPWSMRGGGPLRSSPS